MDKLMALLQALKMTGKAGVDLGAAGLSKGRQLAMEYPRVASGLGGAVAGSALSKILGGDSEPEIDAEDQERRMKLMQMYGA